MENIGKAFWTLLAEKGKLASVVGFFLAFPVNIRFVIDFYQGNVYDYNSLQTIVIINVIAMVWFILPSAIKMSAGKFNLEITD